MQLRKETDDKNIVYFLTHNNTFRLQVDHNSNTMKRIEPFFILTQSILISRIF